MFSFFKNKPAVKAIINGQPITIERNETLLQAALAHGIKFPHNCRVGSCGACKCRLVEGKIKALTDFSYTLDESQLAQGLILACQSQPLEDIELIVGKNVYQKNKGAEVN